MKPFNLEEYLANPSKKVVTRAGRNARIVCTDAKGAYPVVALLTVKAGYEEVEVCYVYNDKGELGRIDTDLDLFFAPEKKVGWINIFRGKDGPLTGNMIFTSKEDAEESKRHCCGFTQGLYQTSIKIEWEE